MPNANTTPEERLLKIIEGTVNPPPVLSAKGGGSKFTFDFRHLEEKIKNLFSDKNSFNSLDLGNVNKAIAGVCVLFTIFWIFNFAREDFVFKERLEKIKIGAAGSIYKEENSPSMEANIGELMASAAKRNIFKWPSQGNEAVAQVLTGPTPKPKAPAEAGVPGGGIKLVGIIWTDNPQAMLEDAKEGKTYLVSAGDNIGDLKIKKILSDKIIVSKGGQEWALR